MLAMGTDAFWEVCIQVWRGARSDPDRLPTRRDANRIRINPIFAPFLLLGPQPLNVMHQTFEEEYVIHKENSIKTWSNQFFMTREMYKNKGSDTSLYNQRADINECLEAWKGSGYVQKTPNYCKNNNSICILCPSFLHLWLKIRQNIPDALIRVRCPLTKGK